MKTRNRIGVVLSVVSVLFAALALGARASTGCAGDGSSSLVVSEYLFTEGSGTNAANTGTDGAAGNIRLVNGAVFSPDVPPANGCGWSLSLPATGTGATTPAGESTNSNYNPLAGATNFTIMAWVKRQSASTASNQSARIVSDTSSTSLTSTTAGVEFRFAGSAGTLAVRVNGTEVSTSVGGIAPNEGNWHHVAVVYDGTRPATNTLTRNVHFYVDGIQRGDGNTLTNVSVASNTNRLTLGNSAVSRAVDSVLVGKLDDVRLLRGYAPAAVGDGKTNAILSCYANSKDDVTPPTVTCPASVITNTAAGQNYAQGVALGTPLTTDNCGVATVTNNAPSTFPIGTNTVTWTVRDANGNSNTCQQLVIVRDLEPPSLSATITPQPNSAGWNKANVTVHFSATDNSGGAPSVTPDVTVTTEGASQKVTGTATDAAGNQTSTNIFVNLDKHPPGYSFDVQPPANDAGWNNSDVIVVTTVYDGLSGVDGATMVTNVFTTEGPHAAGGCYQDLAGNRLCSDLFVFIDKTPPTVAVTPADGATVQNLTPSLTVEFVDAGSGTGVAPVTAVLDGQDITGALALTGATATYTPSTDLATGAHTWSATVTDNAGNAATVSATLTISQPDTTPPTITATITPAPNAAGLNNTNVVVHFSATDAGSRVATVTPDTGVTTEGTEQEVIGTATDHAGNSATTSVFVNIDKTPPALALDPGNGIQFDNSYPLLIVDYADSGTGVSPVSSGLNPDSLAITLNGNDVTTNFYRFGSGAVLSTNLAAGTHTWSATISDYAGNITITTVVFTATGAANTNAPVMANLDLTDDVTIMPDLPEIWVQGKVSGAGSTVTASVNGGDAISMNRRDDVFGYLLPLDPGTNVIVLTASDPSTNLSSRVLRVERSTKYSAGMNWVTLNNSNFGNFANGATQRVHFAVSKHFDDGTTNGLGLSSVMIGTTAVTLPATVGDEGFDFDFDLPPPTCTNSVMPVIVSLCWTGTTFLGDYTNICQNVPLGLLEGYEITRMTVHLQGNGDQALFEYSPQHCPPATPWANYNWLYTTDYSFELPCTGPGNEQTQDAGCIQAANSLCLAAPDLALASWDCSTTNESADVSQPSIGRGLAFGSKVNWFCEGTNCNVREIGWWEGSGLLKFRAPFCYGADTPVIFTLEGEDYARVWGSPLNLATIQFQGQYPVSVDNDHGTASYLITVTGGQEYTIDESSFGTLPSNVSSSPTDSFNEHYLSFSGFHNKLPLAEIRWLGQPVVGSQPLVSGRRMTLTLSLFNMPPNATFTYAWDIPGKRNAGRDWDLDHGKEIPLTETNGNTVTFYWIDHGVHDVRCTVTVTINGVIAFVLQPKATFNLFKPVDAKITTSLRSVDVGANFTAKEGSCNDVYIHFGDLTCRPNEPRGISFDGDATDPKQFPGTLFWLQVVDDWKGHWQGQPSEHVWDRLDKLFPYPNQEEGTGRIHTADSPALDLVTPKRVGVTSGSITMSATMYLMWEGGDYPSFEAVPLRKVEWSWNGTAVKVGNAWSLTSGSAGTSQEGVANELPTWSKNIDDPQD